MAALLFVIGFYFTHAAHRLAERKRRIGQAASEFSFHLFVPSNHSFRRHNDYCTLLRPQQHKRATSTLHRTDAFAHVDTVGDF